MGDVIDFAARKRQREETDDIELSMFVGVTGDPAEPIGVVLDGLMTPMTIAQAKELTGSLIATILQAENPGAPPVIGEQTFVIHPAVREPT